MDRTGSEMDALHNDSVSSNIIRGVDEFRAFFYEFGKKIAHLESIRIIIPNSMLLLLPKILIIIIILIVT